MKLLEIRAIDVEIRDYYLTGVIEVTHEVGWFFKKEVTERMTARYNIWSTVSGWWDVNINNQINAHKFILLRGETVNLRKKYSKVK